MANDSARCNGSHSRSRHTHLQRALTASPPPQVTQTPGNGVGEADEARGTYQTLRWADAYLAEVKAVFGEGQCYADPVASLLVAVKAA